MRFRTFILSALIGSVAFGTAACGGANFGLAPQQSVFENLATFNNEVDILFVVDDSSSMGRHQEQLAQKVGGFLDKLLEKHLDFNIAVTTTDMGRGGPNGRFLSSDGSPAVLTVRTPNLYGVLADRFRAGQDGSSVEQGRSAMKTSLSAPLIDFENAGFLRRQSLLVVIFLSNERDSSPEDDYVSWLDQLKPALPSGERSWVAHFIGVLPNDNSCPTTDFGHISPGSEYMDLAQASGGISAAICSADFGIVMHTIRERIVSILSEYVLPKRPRDGSIRVTINSELIPNDEANGWTYHEDRNSIQFHGSALPGAADRVTIDYDPVSAE